MYTSLITNILTASRNLIQKGSYSDFCLIVYTVLKNTMNDYSVIVNSIL